MFALSLPTNFIFNTSVDSVAADLTLIRLTNLLKVFEGLILYETCK